MTHVTSRGDVRETMAFLLSFFLFVLSWPWSLWLVETPKEARDNQAKGHLVPQRHLHKSTQNTGEEARSAQNSEGRRPEARRID